MQRASLIRGLEDLRAFQTGLQSSTNEERTCSLRQLARTSLFGLLTLILGRKDLRHPWLIARCLEVEAAPDGHLDLWARGHYKSTVITFAKTLQDILASHGEDPLPEWRGLEPTFGIFAHTRPIAKAFLRQIKWEFEQNIVLRALFPDILWPDPRKAPKWSEDDGIVMRRRSNPKEATVEAWGLVDGQPTSKHFDVLIWDDTVTRESVTSPDMIRKTTEAWEHSLNLGSAAPRKRMIGTRYHFADTYGEVMRRGAMRPRLYPATADGALTGDPVLLTPEQLAQKIREMGAITASSQLMQNPIADSRSSFNREDLRYYDDASGWRGMNRALLVDPAGSKKKGSDYTAMAVLGRAADQNVYLLDFVRDRLNLQERIQMALGLHRKWSPRLTGWERYGLQADIEYLNEVQQRENYRFDVLELAGPQSKADRIERLVPLVVEHRLYLPRVITRTLHDKRTVNLTEVLVDEELLAWPVPLHDDGLDVMSRLFDVDLPWPRSEDAPKPGDRYSRRRAGGTWMSG